MVMIVGHRGARNLWLENSLDGFRRTRDLDIEGVRRQIFDELESLLGTLEIVGGDVHAVFGDVEFQPGVVEDFLRDELAVAEFLDAFEVEFFFVAGQAGLIDFEAGHHDRDRAFGLFA